MEITDSAEGKKRTDIWERKEITAPANYASVYHETKTEYLPSINTEGLKLNNQAKNMGGRGPMEYKNRKFDEYRPEEVKNKGISRVSNIFGYPYLEYGHGLLGADKRFVKRDKESLSFSFEAFQKHSPDYLTKLGVNTLDEFVAKMTNPEYLKSCHPGEIPELKIDPKKCCVADMEYFTRVLDLTDRGWSEDEAIAHQAPSYWKSLITLENFLKWYKKPEWAENGDNIKDIDQYKNGGPYTANEFYLLKGAPDSLPDMFYTPEILIPENIHQDKIRVLK